MFCENSTTWGIYYVPDFNLHVRTLNPLKYARRRCSSKYRYPCPLRDSYAPRLDSRALVLNTYQHPLGDSVIECC
ncbi:Uncharacterized protein HZ326_30862 [Fusarium oxysporum f. sp. albedinis]|nr:Uncharacterized protein HZ326_30862 [Fusarium oxysporum f. sp. albedinis]